MVRRAKEIIIYVILSILSAISIILIRFAFVQRRVCLENGYLVEADNCLKLGIVCIVLIFVFFAIMIWTWKRSRRADMAPKKAVSIWSSKLFEDWYDKETADIEKSFGKGKIIAMVFSILMVFSMCQIIFLMLDGMSGSTSVFLLLMDVGVIFLMNYMSDYKRKYIRPLDVSIRKKLPDASAQEKFAKQMSGARKLTYMAAAGSGVARAWLSPDYCYFRQSTVGGIINMKDIGRIELERTSYTVGIRHIHFRTCYAMALFHDGTEKKAFRRMYFKTKGELYNAATEFQRMGVSQSKIQDKTIKP